MSYQEEIEKKCVACGDLEDGIVPVTEHTCNKHDKQ